MKFKTIIAIVLAAVLALSVTGAALAKGKKKSGPVIVGTDEAGDWGNDNATGEDISGAGDSLSFPSRSARLASCGWSARSIRSASPSNQPSK